MTAAGRSPAKGDGTRSTDEIEAINAEWEDLQRRPHDEATFAAMRAFAVYVRRQVSLQPVESVEVRDWLESLAMCAVAWVRAKGDITARLVDISDKRWNG
jgi:hypothetical protein